MLNWLELSVGSYMLKDTPLEVPANDYLVNNESPRRPKCRPLSERLLVSCVKHIPYYPEFNHFCNLVSSASDRGVAQSGSAPHWGCGGRRFKSCRPDHFFLEGKPFTAIHRPDFLGFDLCFVEPDIFVSGRIL